MSNPTASSPLPDLTAAHLNDAHAFFTANPAAVSLVFDVAGKSIHVRMRDLEFIHSLDAWRFGPKPSKCGVCVAESARIEAAMCDD